MMENSLDERKKLIAESCAINARISTMPKNSSLRKQLVSRNNAIVQRLTEMKLAIQQDRNDDVVSDHALVRWLERKHGINVARLKQLIFSPALEHAARSGEKFFSDNDVVFVIDGGVVRTVIPVSSRL